jgi:hypothetical protein
MASETETKSDLEGVRIRLEAARKVVADLEELEVKLMQSASAAAQTNLVGASKERQRVKNDDSQRIRGRKQKVQQDGKISSCSFEESAWDPRYSTST